MNTVQNSGNNLQHKTSLEPEKSVRTYQQQKIRVTTL